LEKWKNAGKTLVIFSSGSVQAQVQFFSYVEDNSSTRDLKPLFSAHFDTVNAGSKLEKASYEKICQAVKQQVGKVSFLTDNAKGKPIFTLSSWKSLLAFDTVHAVLQTHLHGHSLVFLPETTPKTTGTFCSPALVAKPYAINMAKRDDINNTDHRSPIIRQLPNASPPSLCAVSFTLDSRNTDNHFISLHPVL
jgi:hypothetical protein